MKIRPWPIVILAVIQILMPIFSICVNSLITGIDPVTYTKLFVHTQSFWNLIDFFALYPLAGISIYLMKKWSYPVFLGVMAWTFYRNIIVWERDYQGHLTIWIILGISFINLAYTTYYLLPAVRRIYFDKTLRWWESKPRFIISVESLFTVNEKEHPCRILDLSEGGVFFSTDADISEDDKVEIQIPILGQAILTSGKIVHRRRHGQSNGYGFEFEYDRHRQRALRHLILTLSDMGCDLRNKRIDLSESFKSWVRKAATGKEWLPNGGSSPNKS